MRGWPLPRRLYRTVATNQATPRPRPPILPQQQWTAPALCVNRRVAAVAAAAIDATLLGAKATLLHNLAKKFIDRGAAATAADK